AGTHDSRDLRRGHGRPVSTNCVERHAPQRASGIDPTLGHDAGRAFCLETVRRARRDGSDRATVVRTRIRRPILRVPGWAFGRCCCLNTAMSSSPDYLAAIVGAYEFSKFERIVDVGGGHGLLLAGILFANPRLCGVLYDLPAVVADTSALRKEPISQRCEIIGGDFFKGVPAGADAYILKGIIHDWNDEAALRILKNCRRAIHSDGTLLLAETVLSPSTDPASALMDMLMMVLTNGRERTESEC